MSKFFPHKVTSRTPARANSRAKIISQSISLSSLSFAITTIKEDIIKYNLTAKNSEHPIYGDLQTLKNTIESCWSEDNYQDMGKNPVAAFLTEFLKTQLPLIDNESDEQHISFKGHVI